MRLFDRFIAKVTPLPNGCWAWTASRTALGYGRIKAQGRVAMAHRVSYAHFIEALSDDKEIDHLCRHSWCVNPTHLEQVTHTVNVQRGLAAQPREEPFSATTKQRMSVAAIHRAVIVLRCKRGHLYTRANTYFHPQANGQRWKRRCKRCHADAVKAQAA